MCFSNKLVKQPKYNLEESKRRDKTYSVRIFIQAKLNYLDGTKTQEKQIFLGDIPLMTSSGTFLVNGIERIIINQIVRSPGVYYKSEVDKQGIKIYNIVNSQCNITELFFNSQDLCLVIFVKGNTSVTSPPHTQPLDFLSNIISFLPTSHFLPVPS